MPNHKYPWYKRVFYVPCDGELTADGGKLASLNRLVAAANYRTRMYGEKWAVGMVGNQVRAMRIDN